MKAILIASNLSKMILNKQCSINSILLLSVSLLALPAIAYKSFTCKLHQLECKRSYSIFRDPSNNVLSFIPMSMAEGDSGQCIHFSDQYDCPFLFLNEETEIFLVDETHIHSPHGASVIWLSEHLAQSGLSGLAMGARVSIPELTGAERNTYTLGFAYVITGEQNEVTYHLALESNWGVAYSAVFTPYPDHATMSLYSEDGLAFATIEFYAEGYTKNDYDGSAYGDRRDSKYGGVYIEKIDGEWCKEIGAAKTI